MIIKLYEEKYRDDLIPLSEEQEINGIRFTPMKYVVKNELNLMKEISA